MNKIIIMMVFIICLFCGCSRPIVSNINSDLPLGYTKAYHIHGNFLTYSDVMIDFVRKFSNKDDAVISIDDYDFIILRK